MSAPPELPDAGRAAFEVWLKDIPTAEKYSFDSEGRGYQKDRSVMMRMAWQASRKQALEEAARVAQTTCHHEATQFADGFNQAALNIEHAIRSLK